MRTRNQEVTTTQMPTPFRLELSADQRRDLEHVRDYHPKAYARERAAALLKVAAGASATQVASHGLLRHRYPHAVCRWIHRYQAEGLDGLVVRTGRGRKPAFSPSTTKHASSQASNPTPGTS